MQIIKLLKDKASAGSRISLAEDPRKKGRFPDVIPKPSSRPRNLIDGKLFFVHDFHELPRGSSVDKTLKGFPPKDRATYQGTFISSWRCFAEGNSGESVLPVRRDKIRVISGRSILGAAIILAFRADGDFPRKIGGEQESLVAYTKGEAAEGSWRAEKKGFVLNYL